MWEKFDDKKILNITGLKVDKFLEKDNRMYLVLCIVSKDSINMIKDFENTLGIYRDIYIGHKLFVKILKRGRNFVYNQIIKNGNMCSLDDINSGDMVNIIVSVSGIWDNKDVVYNLTDAEIYTN